MDHVQINVVDAKLAKGLRTSLHCSLIPVAGTPHLRLNEQVSASQAGPADGLADALLVLIHLRSVDQAVASLQRHQYRFSNIFILQLVGAETDCWHNGSAGQAYTA